jgi:hypothetical protein
MPCSQFPCPTNYDVISTFEYYGESVTYDSTAYYLETSYPIIDSPFTVTYGMCAAKKLNGYWLIDAEKPGQFASTVTDRFHCSDMFSYIDAGTSCTPTSTGTVTEVCEETVYPILDAPYVSCPTPLTMCGASCCPTGS